MKKVYYTFSLIICFALICTACGKKEVAKSNSFLDDISLTLTDQKSTENKNNHTYQVRLKNSKNKEVEVDSVLLELEMKSMNHHTKGKMKKIKKGLYEVTIELPMDGTWSKHITIKKENYSRKINTR